MIASFTGKGYGSGISKIIVYKENIDNIGMRKPEQLV